MGPYQEKIILCPRCGGRLTWTKVTTYTAGGFYDWRLDIRCACGPVDDPETAARIRARYDKMTAHRIRTEQEKNLAAGIGRRAFNHLKRR